MSIDQHVKTLNEQMKRPIIEIVNKPENVTVQPASSLVQPNESTHQATGTPSKDNKPAISTNTTTIPQKSESISQEVSSSEPIKNETPESETPTNLEVNESQDTQEPEIFSETAEVDQDQQPSHSDEHKESDNSTDEEEIDTQDFEL